MGERVTRDHRAGETSRRGVRTGEIFARRVGGNEMFTCEIPAGALIMRGISAGQVRPGADRGPLKHSVISFEPIVRHMTFDSDDSQPLTDR
jgi:hypothetical protein